MTTSTRKKPPIPHFPERGEPTALVVHDQAGPRRATAETLEGFGFVVFTAGSTEEAIRTAEELGGPLDLLVTEATLADSHGDHLVRWLWRLGVRPCVLYTSSRPREELTAMGFRALRARILLRPFDGEDLAHEVRTLLEL